MGQRPLASATVPTGATPRPTAWAPLRHRAFRVLWAAQFASNVGTWMQTVGAQWLVGDLGGSAFLVALVQTASSLPVFLLALPSGALGDILDRRRVLLFGQSVMLVAAALITTLTLLDLVTPGVVLALTFAIGAGQAFVTPSWQAVQPELVPRREIPQAAVLNGTSFNLARALGPAIGGVLITASGPGAVFALNAVSFVAVLVALGSWHREAPPRRFAAEQIGPAIAAGLRFVRSAPNFQTVLVRAGHFMAFASALWALLPVIARDELDLGAGGYGLMLGAVGVGAVGGALTLPWLLRGRLEVERVVGGAGLVFAAAMVVVGVGGSPWVAAPALVLAGGAWIGNNSLLMASAQVLVPGWARARALSSYTLVFMGSQALGAVVWGAVAALTSTRVAFLLAAAGLSGGVLALRLWRPLRGGDADFTPLGGHFESDLIIEAAPSAGPVLITVEWRVPMERHGEFHEAMRVVERVRRRTGARRWELFQDGKRPELLLEVYVVATWEEYQRQRTERTTVHDAELESRAIELTTDGGPPHVRTAISTYR